jgi:TPR repeat protein
MRARVLIGLCLLTLILASSAHADVVTLTNGNELRGRVLEETDEKVVLQTAGGKLTFPRRQVASVVRDEASAAGAERRPPRSTEAAPPTTAGELPAARLDMTAAHVAALTAARDAGDAEATLRLGIAHEYGLGGLAVDRARAREHYERAAKAGHVYAITRLSRILEKTVSREVTVRLYQRAADLGDPFAKGWNIAGGDRAGALRWYREAAERGDALAMVLCEKYHRLGFGTPMDPLEAARWARRAAEAGDPTGMSSVGLLYARGVGVAVDWVEAARWYRLAADRGVAAAMGNLAWCYAKGRGVAADPVESLRWYREASRLGSEYAMTNLAWLLERGEGGVEKDEAEAARLYRRALRQGHGPAKAPLAALLQRSPGLHEEADDALLANSSDEPWVEQE